MLRSWKMESKNKLNLKLKNCKSSFIKIYDLLKSE